MSMYTQILIYKQEKVF